MKSEIIKITICLFIGSALSVYLGQDANFDLLHYHIYNAYAFLNGRHYVDFAPVAFQTYFPPAADVPYYLLATKILPEYPRIVAAFQGLPYGTLLYAALKLNEKLFPLSAAIAATAIGATAAATFSEIGTVFNDIPIAALIVGAVALLLQPRTSWLVFCAGLLLGATNGIKLYGAFYGVAATAALFLGSSTRKFRDTSLFIFGSSISFVAFYVPWGVHLWRVTGNPVYPYFNAIFRSGYYPPETMSPNMTHLTGWGWILAPISWSQRHFSLVTEMELRDARLLIALVCFTAISLVLMFRSFRGTKPSDNQIFILVFACLSYLLWITQFRILRYAIPLEILTGTLIVFFIQMIPVKPIPRHLAAASVFLALWQYTIVPQWGRVPFGKRVISVDADPLPKGSLVIVTGQPVGYVIPFLRGENLSFVGMTWLNKISPLVSREALKRISNHVGKIFVLIGAETPDVKPGDKQFIWGQCSAIKSTYNQNVRLCPVRLAGGE